MRATYTAGRERLYNTTINNINKSKSIEDINTERITDICWDVSAFLKVVPKRDKAFVDLCSLNIHISMPRFSQALYHFGYPSEALSQGTPTSCRLGEAYADEPAGIAGRSLAREARRE
jgi:hypothetical protein